jgi:hypothetical protein
MLPAALQMHKTHIGKTPMAFIKHNEETLMQITKLLHGSKCFRASI